MTHEFCQTILESVMILVFEGLGTMLLTCLFMSCLIGTALDSLAFFVGFFILLIFSARISGSHFNPSVTLAFMLRKDTGRFSRWLGLAYMLFQMGGAWCGGIFAYFILKAQTPLTVTANIDDTYGFQSLTQQSIGTALLVFLYLTQTEKETKLAADPAITTMIIAAAYVCSASIGWSGYWTVSPLNFAVSLAMISASTFDGAISDTNWQWTYLAAPWIGACFAILFFELVFKRMVKSVETHGGADEDEEAVEDAEVRLMNNQVQ